jgi:hypothetical protein
VAVDGMAPPCFAGAGASGYLRRPGAPGLLLLAVVVVAAQVLGFFGSRLAERLPAVNPLYDLPSFADRLSELVREDIRQSLSYLDPYLTLVLRAGAVIYLFGAANADREVSTVMSVVAVAIMGTAAQCLFGLDGFGGLAGAFGSASWPVMAQARRA